jgi:hypothetical protein
MKMSEKVTIEPKYIGEFIEWLGLEVYHQMGGSEKPWEKLKEKEREALRGTVKLVAEAISKGLILAKRQPELVDAQIQYLNTVRAGYVDLLLNQMLDSYKPFLYYKHFEGK